MQTKEKLLKSNIKMHCTFHKFFLCHKVVDKAQNKLSGIGESAMGVSMMLGTPKHDAIQERELSRGTYS